MKDKKWIRKEVNSAIERSRKKSQKDTEHYLAVLIEKQEHDMLAMKEFMSAFPTRSEVRDIIREETPPIIREVFRTEFMPYLVKVKPTE